VPPETALAAFGPAPDAAWPAAVTAYAAAFFAAAALCRHAAFAFCGASLAVYAAALWAARALAASRRRAALRECLEALRAAGSGGVVPRPPLR